MTEIDLKFQNPDEVLRGRNTTIRYDMEQVPEPEDSLVIRNADGEFVATATVFLVAHVKFAYAFETANKLGNYADDKGEWVDRMIQDYYPTITADAPVRVIKFNLDAQFRNP